MHGQFYDLIELFNVAGGMPNDAPQETSAATAPAITDADLEPPSRITDPRAKRKMKRRFQADSKYTLSSSPPAEEDEFEEDGEEHRGRSRSISQRRSINSDRAKGVDGSRHDNSNVNALANGQQNFIFLGDFVDRGYFSLETFTLLMCLKARYVLAFANDCIP